MKEMCGKSEESYSRKLDIPAVLKIIPYHQCDKSDEQGKIDIVIFEIHKTVKDAEIKRNL